MVGLKLLCGLYFETAPALFFAFVFLILAGPALCILLGFLGCCTLIDYHFSAGVLVLL